MFVEYAVVVVFRRGTSKRLNALIAGTSGENLTTR
jgi:hypothetical protein